MWQGRRGAQRSRLTRAARAGLAWPDAARQVSKRWVRCGSTRFGMAGRAWFRLAKLGVTWIGMARQARDRRRGVSRRGRRRKPRPGFDRPGNRGTARTGYAGSVWWRLMGRRWARRVSGEARLCRLGPTWAASFGATRFGTAGAERFIKVRLGLVRCCTAGEAVLVTAWSGALPRGRNWLGKAGGAVLR